MNFTFYFLVPDGSFSYASEDEADIAQPPSNISFSNDLHLPI